MAKRTIRIADKKQRKLFSFRKFLILLIGLVIIATYVTMQKVSSPESSNTSLKTPVASLLPENNGLTYGIAAGGGLPFKSPSNAIKYFGAVKAAGFTQVRFDMTWDLVQPKNATTFDWTVYDRLMTEMTNAGLKANIILDKTPRWARIAGCNDSFCPPSRPEQFAIFASQAASRYRGKVAAWEVWNEPNTYVFWKPAPNAAAYTTLLQQTYTAIKLQDITAIVLFGGLSGSTGDGDQYHIDGRTFLTEAYAAGAKNFFDALAYHPYTNLNMPNTVDNNNGWSKLDTLSTSIRSVMALNGDSAKSIWLNEIGIPTGGPKRGVVNLSQKPSTATMDHVSEAIQADFVEQVVDESEKLAWVDNVSWYSLQDNGIAMTTPENFYGLIRNDGSPKPAYNVIETFLKQRPKH